MTPTFPDPFRILVGECAMMRWVMDRSLCTNQNVAQAIERLPHPVQLSVDSLANAQPLPGLGGLPIDDVVQQGGHV